MAMQMAEAIFQHVLRNFGLPEDIVSDRGQQFTSRVWGALCAQLGIGVSLSSGYHPQSNGQAERLNQEIDRFLRSYCSREQQRWSEFLPWAEYVQNSLTHSSTGLTPFQCVLGYQPPLFPWSGEPSEGPAVEEWSRLSQEVWERAHVRLQRAVRRQRIQANRRRHPHPPYWVGQMVWLPTWNLRLKLPCRMLSPKFVGPFEIIRQVNPVAYRLRLVASYRICPTFHVSLLKPARPLGSGEMSSVEPPPPLDIEGSPAYLVQALLDSRRVRSGSSIWWTGRANSLLNLSIPRWNVGSGPDTMILVVGDVVRTSSTRLLKSFFRISVCLSLMSFVPAWRTTAPMFFFRIAGTCDLLKCLDLLIYSVAVFDVLLNEPQAQRSSEEATK
ncbi:hypothetical protein QTP70_019746, partial [Hemibagrus guttatus]